MFECAVLSWKNPETAYATSVIHRLLWWKKPKRPVCRSWHTVGDKASPMRGGGRIFIFTIIKIDKVSKVISNER